MARTTRPVIARPPAEDLGQKQPYTDGSISQPILDFAATTWASQRRDLGSYGLRQFSGWVREEFLPQLRGRQLWTTYREMLDNNAAVGAIVHAITQAMRSVRWRDVPANDSAKAKKMADFAASLRDDCSHTWDDFVAESLTMLGYGVSVHELVWKRRTGHWKAADTWTDPASKYDDNMIGFRRLPIRGQDTIWRWYFDDNGQITGMQQQPYTGNLIDLPVEKLLIFRPTAHKNNPEGRPLCLDTPIPTPEGWKNIGEILIGGKVFDETGAQRTVTGKSEIFRDRPTYEIEFTTGGTIRADASHLWRVTDYNDRTWGTIRDLTTEQIAQAFDASGDARMPGVHTTERWRNRRARSICCGVAPVLQTESVGLPLDPYMLGYWLGDGVTGHARVAVHPTDFDSLKANVEAAGFQARHDGDHIAAVTDGLFFGLRAAGVLRHKHVPSRYLRASAAQRLALLQGLMDADGYSPPLGTKDEASTFANTNTALVSGVEELVRSLGGQPRIRVLEEAGALGGVINGKQIIARQTSYEVRFMLDLPVHRLPRKRDRQALRKTHRNSGHFIKSVRRVENSDTVCIEVDSPSHLFLAGRSMVPTHNSILRSAYRSHYFIKRLEEMESILFERLSGIPVVKIPSQIILAAQSGTDKNATAAYQAFQKMVTDVRVNEEMGLVLPSDMWSGANGPTGHPMYEFSLVTPQSGHVVDPNPLIQRYKLDILKSVLADFIDLGHQARGTQNLAITKMDMFYKSIEGWLHAMAAVYNRYGVGRCWRLNGLDEDLMPMCEPDMASRLDLDQLGNFVLHLFQAGIPMGGDEEAINYLRHQAGLPELDEGTDLRELNAPAPAPGPGDQPGDTPATRSANALIRVAARQAFRRIEKEARKPTITTAAPFLRPIVKDGPAPPLKNGHDRGTELLGSLV